MQNEKRDYLSEFLSLRCSGDVLNVVNPLGKKAKKEITESMAMIRMIRPVTLNHPMRYHLYDLCAGNALTSVIASHLLPINFATAIDIKERNRNWYKAKRFKYIKEDIFKVDPFFAPSTSIIMGVHACKGLAERIIEIYNDSAAQFLFLMPCCCGNQKGDVPFFFREKLGPELSWCLHLSQMCKGKVSVIQDKDILSPKNIIIRANKGE